MGLDTRSSYVVSQTHSSFGTKIDAVTLINNNLNLTLPSGVTRLRIYPNRGNLPVLLTLQNGSQGYDGVTDTWLYGWTPDVAYGDASSLSLRPEGVAKILLRFDLKNILPDDIQITAANLKLYDTNIGPDMTLNLHRMLRPWDETTATYNQAAAGTILEHGWRRARQRLGNAARWAPFNCATTAKATAPSIS